MSSFQSAQFQVRASTLYLANRGSRRLTRSNPSSGFEPDGDSGDGNTIAIILLSHTSKNEVETVVLVGSGVEWIRGMKDSGDGRYFTCCGDVGGGLEVYEIGEILELVTKDAEVRDVDRVLSCNEAWRGWLRAFTEC